MTKQIFPLLLLCIVQAIHAQKKPLDHTVYDAWQSIGERLISPDGQWVVYTIDPQEGDRQLVIRSAKTGYHKIIERGYNAEVSRDSKWVVFRIAPLFRDTRDAKIKKKKTEDLPKDSLAIVRLGDDSVWKKANVHSFSLPEKGNDWLVYQMEKPTDPSSKNKSSKADQAKNDSLVQVIDSLKSVINGMSKKSNRDHRSKDSDWLDRNGNTFSNEFTDADADGDDASSAPADLVSDLIIHNLSTNAEQTFHQVSTWVLSEKGNRLVFRQSPKADDSTGLQVVMLSDLSSGRTDTISKGGNDFKNFAFSHDGDQLAFVAERDANAKELMKYYKLWYWKSGADTATILVDKQTVGMKMGMTISEFGKLEFSRSGQRLFFNTAPVQPPKDTTLVDIDLVKLDVWNYQDDYLQTVQLNKLSKDLQLNYLAVYDLRSGKPQQLASEAIPLVYQTAEGDGDRFVGVSDVGYRIQSQWTGGTLKDLFAINVNDGSSKLVKKALDGVMSSSYISTTGRYILWYDNKAKNYFLWDGDSTRNITAGMKVPLYDEEYDMPGFPTPFNVMGWQKDDSAVYINDHYDVWKLSLSGPFKISSLTRSLGRSSTVSYYPLVRDPEKRFYSDGDKVLFRRFNNKTKESGLSVIAMDGSSITDLSLLDKNFLIPTFIPRRSVSDSNRFIITRETFVRSPDLYLYDLGPMTISTPSAAGRYTLVPMEQKLSTINPQQKDYNWGTAELYHFATVSGKQSDGILYKPENFDPSRKYPVIFYFYEKLTDGLYSYQAPSPTPSRLNIPFYVSRGYLVFAPDIRYTIGHPAKSAYDYIVGAAKDLGRNSWVDEQNMGIQGQSWGGIQVAQLVTMTDIFKAAWAGAPVANMTSAYGGIRWESGVTRQFQYEQSQSRIGATLWEKPELYIENSPLFSVPNIKTPLVIMSNDADGAVPWYQGIELFTAMRRLNKKVWLLNYNGEAHNLVQRKNRKDIQIREQQYFDWLLKGAKPPVWITTGVPAVKKGKSWGLELSGN